LKIRLEDIPVLGREEIFTEEEGPLNERLGGETANVGLRFVDPIRVRASLSRSGRGVLVTSRIEVRARCICARCLEAFYLNLASQFQTSLKPKPDSPPAEEIELSREDLETDFYEGEEIDLSPLIRDQVLLTIPPKLVCREDCRGLCQGCGLAVLRNFRVH
jgi:uncharacterized protein